MENHINSSIISNAGLGGRIDNLDKCDVEKCEFCDDEGFVEIDYGDGNIVERKCLCQEPMDMSGASDGDR